MFETYIPGFSNMLMNSDMLTFQPELTGGGPAYATITPDFMPEPAEGPAPAAMTPQDDFLERIRRAEAMVPVAQPPSIMPSPSAPPIMSAPDFGALNIGGPAFAPSFSNELFRSQLLNSDAGLTGGGPAYASLMPGQALAYDGEPMDQPGMVPGAQASQPPSIMPSPSAPPMMSAPGAYVPGFTPMLLNQATPERVSMLPFAPEAPASASTPAVDLSALAGLTINPMFFGTGLSGQPTQQSADLFIDPATGLTLSKPRTVELDETGRLVREITPEGSVPGVYFTDNRGISATAGLGKGARFTPLNPNAVYTVINQRTGEVVSTGTGAEGLKAAQRATAELSKAGRKSDWAVVMNDAATGAPKVVANVDPRPSALGQFADVVLPAALAMAVPGLGLVGSKVLGAGLGAAGGSALSSIAQGRSLEDTLMRAGISGLASAAGAGIGGKIGGALGKTAPVAGETAGQIAGTVAGKTAPILSEIIVPGSLGALTGSKIGTVAGAGLADRLANMAPGKGADFADRVFEQPTTPAVQVPSPLDTVAGAPIVVTNTGGGALPIAAAGAGALAQPGVDAAINSIKQQIEKAQKQAEQEPENQIVVRPTDTFDEAFAPFVPPNVGTLNVPEDEIVVTASGKAPTSFDEKVTPPLAPTLPDLTKTPVDVQGPEKDLIDQLKDRIKGLDVVDYLRLAGVLLPLLDGGGGGSRASRTLPSGMFGGSSIFSGGLPRATLPGASTGFAPRTAADLRPKTTQDWYRYGYGPEQSFFSYVPEGERNLSQAYTGYAHGGMAEGGDTFAVNGPGTGRSDEIPAMLSDGEYVIDAETVALLGDGSSKAGAERLDQFRINVRRDKGRKLAKGEFSVDAKRPEHYLKGGRA